MKDGGVRYDPPVARGPRVLVVDNYDSFTFNLVQYLLELGAIVDVYRNDAITADEVVAAAPTHVLLSPGPGRPTDSGVCQELCRRLTSAERIPLLGVCLGHQTLAEVLGGKVGVADRIMHGKVSPILHDGQGLFTGLPSPMLATRYHSLIVHEEGLPEVLVPCARTDRGELMAVRHRDRPVHGVQFHPESILSEHGHALLGRFLGLAWPAAESAARPGGAA